MMDEIILALLIRCSQNKMWLANAACTSNSGMEKFDLYCVQREREEAKVEKDFGQFVSTSSPR